MSEKTPSEENAKKKNCLLLTGKTALDFCDVSVVALASRIFSCHKSLSDTYETKFVSFIFKCIRERVKRSFHPKWTRASVE